MKKTHLRSLLVFGFLLFTINCFAQKKKQPPVDSLLTELLKAKTDTGKAWLLIQLSNQNCSVNPDEGIKYGEQALALSQKIKWEKGIVNANLSMGDCYQEKADYPKALGYSLNALKICEDYKDTLRMPITLYSIGRIYFAQHDFPKAIAYGYKHQ